MMNGQIKIKVVACRILHATTCLWRWNRQSTKYHRQQPLYNALELLMMGIMVPWNILSKQ